MTINLAELPAIPFAERKALPDEPAVYFVLDAADTVLYVGQSKSLARRWIAHHRIKQFRANGACRIAWLTVSDPSLLLGIEQACIAHFHPTLDGVASGRVLLRLSERMLTRLRAEAKRRDLPDATTVQQLMRERLDQMDGGATSHEAGAPAPPPPRGGGMSTRYERDSEEGLPCV